MPQDPVTLAIIGGAFVLLANAVGQSIAAFLGTRAAARISQRTALDVAVSTERTARAVEHIRAESAQLVDRERDRRAWRRNNVGKYHDKIHERLLLFQDLNLALGLSNQQDAESILNQLRRRETSLGAAAVAAATPAMTAAILGLSAADRDLMFDFSSVFRQLKTLTDVTERVTIASQRYTEALIAFDDAVEAYIYGDAVARSSDGASRSRTTAT